jgi:hypothetical protein
MGYGTLTFPHLVGQLSGGPASTPGCAATAEERFSSVTASGIIAASVYTDWLVKVKGAQFWACLYIVLYPKELNNIVN